METLKEIAQRIGNHIKLLNPSVEDFLPIYDKHWTSIRSNSIKMLEIGILHGGSLRIWREYFPNGQIFGADNSNEKLYQEDRINCFHLDQSNVSSIQSAAGILGNDVDIILDDGGHYMHHQINSLIHLWKLIKSGGMYIIEDLGTSYWSEFGGSYKGKTTIEFLKNLIDNLNAMFTTDNLPVNEAKWNTIKSRQNPYQTSPVPQLIENINDTLDSIHFYKALAILYKR